MKKSTIIIILIALSIAIAHAAVGDSAPEYRETWTGKGTLLSPDRTPLCTYDIKLVMDRVAPDTVVRRVFVQLPNGKNIDNYCKYSGSDANGWAVSCKENGKASTTRTTLSCFEGGICQEISAQADGQITTTTIIEMSDTELHLVRATMQNGQVTTVAHDLLNRVSR